MTDQPRRRFDGRVAFVTGGGSGMGRATALAFAAEGATIVAADINEANAKQTVDTIEADGGKALAVQCDVTRGADVKAALDQVITNFGHLDIAFNNAGLEQPYAHTADITDEVWDKIVGVNLTGIFQCLKAEIPLMLANGGGVIVNTSAGAGTNGVTGKAAYVAAKTAVIGLTKSAALDYATQGIRVNAICPGIVETPMMGRFTGGTDEGIAKAIAQEPIGRLGRPEEIAAAVLFLCSDEASFVMGHAMVIDGAQTVRLS